MVLLQRVRPQVQAEIFADYGWWDTNNLLNRITAERCTYIETRVDTIFGRGALRQQAILEVGCGGGLICEGLARRGAVTVGIDPSHSALTVAREHTQHNGLGHLCFFEQGYAEALPYANGSFSAIVCLDVLEHVRDLDATIKEIARVLAPGGILIFDTINRTFLARLALIWIGERFFQKSGLVPGLHHYQDFIPPRQLQRLLLQKSLHVHELTGFMPQIKQGRIVLGPGWFKGVSYIGYATRET